MQLNSAIQIAFLLTGSLLVSACTSVPKDGGVSDVTNILGERLSNGVQLPAPGTQASVDADDVESLLSEPLSLIDAERLSLEVNPVVKAKLLNVGIAAADYAQAGRLENPGVAFERFETDEYSGSILFDIGGLLLMPLKRKLTGRQLEIAKYQAAADVLEHVADTRRAWFNAVAARQELDTMMTALESAQVNNTLKRQMSALGHSNTVEAAQSEMLLGDIQAAITRQRVAHSQARETLIRKLGLWGEAARTLKVPSRLPKLPQRPLSVSLVEGVAVKTRLDVQMAMLNFEATASNYKLTRLSPFMSAVELGPVREISGDERERGFELEFRLPVFDLGGLKSKKAKYVYEQSKAQASHTAVAAASDARHAMLAYQSSWDIANNYENVMLPLRERISKERLLEYNGMLISVFELLSDVRVTTDLQTRYIAALRDFWIADTNLQAAMTGTGSTPMSFEGAGSLPGSGAADADH